MPGHRAAQDQVAINAEDSAQGSTAKPNKLMGPSLGLVRQQLGSAGGSLRVADQGCGRLRHLTALTAEFEHIWLVDTATQLDRQQILFNKKQSVREVARTLDGQLVAIDQALFREARLGLDAIFCFCVYDVVTQSVRAGLAADAAANLRDGGLYVVVVPRNDSSILRRCTAEKAYEDGYLFLRNGSVTFYANFREPGQVTAPISAAGLSVVADRSAYRYLWLIFQKQPGSGPTT
jgi:SAM-dependent methyltransferase